MTVLARPLRHRCAFTLIEMLIVIAIMAILSVTVGYILIVGERINAAENRQQAALEGLAATETSWRSDVHAAASVAQSAGEFKATSTSLILQVTDGATSSAESRVYLASPNEDKTVRVERIRLDSAAKIISRQTLALSLESAEFDAVSIPGFLTLSLDATRGLYPYRSRQRYTALAALGKLP